MDKSVLDTLIKLLEQKDFKKKLMKQLNNDIDIPLINEKTEQKILDKVYEIIISTIKNIEFNGKIILLTKNTKKSKFLTPSVAGNLLFSLAHELSVISLIPTNLDLLNPFLYSS